MGFYKNPKEMYTARAERFRRDGNTHWAQAKNGEGGYHYTQAQLLLQGGGQERRQGGAGPRRQRRVPLRAEEGRAVSMSIYKPGRPSKYDPFTGKGSPPPSAPGEYRIRDAAGSIAYVGETNDLRRRMGEHLRHGKLAQEETRGGTLEWKTADGRSSSRTRRQHEQAKIARHDPPLNRSVGGEGRIAARKKK